MNLTFNMTEILADQALNTCPTYEEVLNLMCGLKTGTINNYGIAAIIISIIIVLLLYSSLPDKLPPKIKEYVGVIVLGLFIVEIGLFGFILLMVNL